MGVHRRLIACLAALALVALVGCGDRLAAGGPGPLPPGATPAGTATGGPPSPAASASIGAIGSAIVITPLPSGVVRTPAPPTAPPTPAPTITPVPSGALSLAQLKYRLIDRFGRLWYCDPDYYPIARADEATLAEQRFPQIQQDAATFAAILAHLGYPTQATYTSDQKLAIYRDWKMLGALSLDPQGAAYHFAARFTADGRTGTLVDGTIDPLGAIAVASQSPSGPPICPICLARGTRIDTPLGAVAVEALHEGMPVWTLDPAGARVAATILAIGSMAAPSDHEVVHLVLADGRALSASPSHPLSDGRPLGSIAVGDVVDGAAVVSADRVAYGGGMTFDLLPSGSTGSYWADGVPLRSTIQR